MQPEERQKSHYQQQAEALAEAVERQQIADQAMKIWQSSLGNAIDEYESRYFEGKVTLSRLRVIHYNLIARSCQRSGHERTDPSTNSDRDDRTQTANREPAIRAKDSLEITLARKERDTAIGECDSHRAKARAFTMLGIRCRELGMESNARSYEARADLERAATHEFERVIKTSERRLEDLGVHPVAREKPSDLKNCFDGLEQADRNLDAYYHSRMRALIEVRQVQNLEVTIRDLEAAHGSQATKPKEFEDTIYQRDMAAAHAEREVLASVEAYKRYQDELQSVYTDYNSLNRVLTGKPLERIKPHSYQDDLEKTESRETLHETEGNLEGPGRVVTERKISDTSVKEPERDQLKADSDDSDSHRRTIPEQRQHSVAVGVVVGQILQEMDREM